MLFNRYKPCLSLILILQPLSPFHSVHGDGFSVDMIWRETKATHSARGNVGQERKRTVTRPLLYFVSSLYNFPKVPLNARRRFSLSIELSVWPPRSFARKGREREVVARVSKEPDEGRNEIFDREASRTAESQRNLSGSGFYLAKLFVISDYRVCVYIT